MGCSGGGLIYNEHCLRIYIIKVWFSYSEVFPGEIFDDSDDFSPTQVFEIFIF